MQALPIRSVDEREVRDLSESAYSHSGLALDDDDEEFEAYCEACDDYFDCVSPCPACGGKLIDEDGCEVTADEDDDDGTIAVLEM